MIEKKDVLVKVEERYGGECLIDSYSKKLGPTVRRPQGHVEVYEVTKDNKKRLLRKSNLIVNVGREMIAQHTLNVESSASPDKDEFVWWLGLGSGGTNPGDPFDPVPPVVSDTDLDTEIPINAVDTTCADFHDAAYYKHPFDDVTFEEDTNNDSAWLIARVVTTLGSTDAVDQQINEAGLFSATSTAGGHSGPFHLFSRVTFPTVLKTSENQLIFVWYLYF